MLYSSLADDFYLYCHLNTLMDLPTGRDTVLHFFGQVSKAFPTMTRFEPRDGGEFSLEEDKDTGSYRWMSLEPRRLASGYLNPPDLKDCHVQHELMLELAPPLLSVSHLDCEALDVMFGFDFAFKGNHDEVVAQVFGSDSRFDSFLRIPNAKPVNFEPTMTLALDESTRRQARLGIVTRTNSQSLRSNSFAEESISVYFTIRQYWESGPGAGFVEAYREQVEIGLELLDTHIVPNVVQPLQEAIAAR